MRSFNKQIDTSRSLLQTNGSIFSNPDSIPTAHPDRKGSVLLVVIGLLGMLLLVGIAFYSFAGQEQVSSQNYADAAKVDNSGLSPDVLWSFALEQLIVGSDAPNRTHSALWGRRHALLSGILGRNLSNTNFEGFDLTPFNGKGINLQYTATGDPFVDQNFDGTDDANATLLNINFSAAANGGSVGTFPSNAEPDVDYTAPDINSLALSFVGRGVDRNGVDVNVIIPSFHRPQLLRSGGTPIPNWQSDIGTPQRVLRPHPEHLCAGSTKKRFVPSIPNALGQPVAPFPFGSSTSLKQGVWDLAGAPAGAQTYQWDVDNDGDSIKEGIWLDLDFPAQTLSDGRMYVPLFSFTVVDADGLINLNIAGNQSGLLNTGLPLANGRQISRSNQGLSRSEISPEWAMLADPASDPAPTTQANLFWNTAAGSISRMEMANIETLFLNIGRPEFQSLISGSGTYTIPGGGSTTYEPATYYPGRYGELELMARNNYNMSTGKGMAGYGDGAPSDRDFSLIPQPGRSNQLFGGSGDDDSDSQTGYSRFDNPAPPNNYLYTGTAFLRQQSNTAIPPYVHPLDFWGNGNNLQAGVTGLRAQLYNSGLTVPMQWPYYSSGYSSPGNEVPGSGFVNYLNAGSGNLLASAHVYDIDEPDEIITEWELASTNPTMLQDDVFGPDNLFELQATDVDITNATLQARVRDLAPYNFKLAQQAQAIRKQYTVLSHDRSNFGLSPFVRRTWEFNGDSNGNGSPDFPPSFPLLMAADPIRGALRQLLFVDQGQLSASSTLTQLRLNLNRLLTSYDTTNGPVVAGVPVGVPVYRELTSHPASNATLANTPIVSSSWNPDAPSGLPTAADQEWWARLDRQHMARDIYVLLYLFGGGQDGTSYVVPNTGNLYSPEQMREMAQFAVNVVDALDRDDVITKFEYDKNLADGWNVTDNAYDTTDVGIPDHGVVYGVEAQKLTLSEVLGFVSKQVKDTSGNGIDHPSTQIKDDAGDRYFTYMELRNASPFNVDLLNGAWQIAVQAGDGPDGIPNSGDETDIVQLTPYRASKSASSIITPGATFTIGTRGGPAATDPNDATKNLPSIFRVEYTTGSVTPDFSTEATVIAPQTSTSLDLDLIPTTAGAPNIATQFRISDGTSILGSGTDVTASGNFLYGPNGVATGNVVNIATPLNFVLRRRANLNRQMPIVYDTATAATHVPQSQDNPWVEVDRITLTWKQFQLQQDMSADDMQRATTIQGVIGTQSLTSMERAQPFSKNFQEVTHPVVGMSPTTPDIPFQSHTVGGYNSNSPGFTSLAPADKVFNQAQLHFDRDFASPIDLLSVPLYGPDEVTRRVGQSAKFDRASTTPIPLASDKTSYLAQERFLRPMHIENLNARMLGVPLTYPTPLAAATAISAATDAPIKDNRWFRILEFLDVPTQSEQGMRVYPYALRSSGAINLNTVRTRGVLAGLIDDPDNPDNPAAPNPPYEGHLNPQFTSESAMLVDTYEPGVRNWWLEFLESRDGIDPLTDLILPGTPTGRPFRSLTFAERNSTSVDDTVLRSLPLDLKSAASLANFTDRRSLFEARTNNDRPSIGGGDFVDPLTRHRLLRKVANNSTTRSNVFVVWITTRFFEAVQIPGTSEIQIGDVLKGTEDHRGFFVIDRSLPETAYDSNTGKFSYHKFVQYRKTIQ
ncbi:MAG: hypothetical protein V4719_11765 [Planctomycetota bacterium]